MQTLRLTEYVTEPGVVLGIDERDALRSVAAVVPTLGAEGRYDVTPGSIVGAIEVGSWAVELRPKLPIDRVMFLVSYALDPARWKDTGFDFEEQDSLVEAMVPGFIAQVARALRKGPLHGYRHEEEALATVRGRIRVDEQVRRRFGIAPPIEVAYDDFTDDITENRLLKAAIRRLGRLRIRSAPTRSALRAFDAALATVTDVDYHPRHLPSVTWTRLNEHYRPAVRLAELILRGSSFELRHGSVRTSAFLLDMNRVFEDFVVVALREALGLGPHQLRQGDVSLRLDVGRRIRLEPDLSWWADRRCRFVGDVKYKRVSASGIKHPDLYQLLAYVVAADLPAGLLVYAAGEDEPKVHEVVHLGRRLEVVTLTLDGPPAEVLAQVEVVADRIRELALAPA